MIEPETTEEHPSRARLEAAARAISGYHCDRARYNHERQLFLQELYRNANPRSRRAAREAGVI